MNPSNVPRDRDFLSLRRQNVKNLGDKEGPHTTKDVAQMNSPSLANAPARQQAEHAWRQQDKRLKPLLETTRAVPWEADAATWQFTYIGPQAVKLLGYPPEQWYEKDFWVRHIHPDDRDSAVKFCLDSSARTQDYELEYRMAAADGRTVWIHDIINVVLQNGAPNLHRGFMIDVTEQKQVEEALRESEGRYRAVVEGSLQGMYICRDGIIGFSNEPLIRMLGYASARELIGQDYRVLVAPHERARLEGYRVARLGGEPAPSRYEFQGMRKDGAPLWLECLVSLVPWDRKLAILTTFLDITERQQSEERLREALAEVERLKDRLEQENVYLQHEIKVNYRHEEITGEGDVIRRVLHQVEQVARTSSSVLILGETGVGKELVARAIHRSSARGERAMVKVNCAGLPSTLVETELFGREKGAYTGALSRQVGRFEVADGSTIFLDEIGELPLDLQVKLLRVLQDGQFERLGSTRTIRADVRVIAASNRDLLKAMRAGAFREDLYYRLNVFPIFVPPLRERREDIPALVWEFIREFEGTMGKNIELVPRKIMEALERYKWPGNIRELRNVIERAMIVSAGPELRVEVPRDPDPTTPDSLTLEDIERRHILGVLDKTGWRVRGERGAAALLGFKPTTLEARMQKLGVRRVDRSSDSS